MTPALATRERLRRGKKWLLEHEGVLAKELF